MASQEIDAPPATVFALVNDFKRVVLWSPSLEADPDAQVEFSGPNNGVGASMHWNGLALGSGSQQITVSRPYEYIETVINPDEPGSARAWFDFRDAGAATVVNWTFETDYGYNLVGRYAALLLQRVIRSDYERGLRNLADLAESLPRTDFSDLEIDWLEVAAQDIAYRPTSSPPDPEAMAAALGRAYFQVLSFIGAHELSAAGAPLSISRSFDGNEMRFDAAIPVRGVTGETARVSDKVRLGKSYAGRALRVTHQGPYRDLVQTHRKITAYLAAHGVPRNGTPGSPTSMIPPKCGSRKS